MLLIREETAGAGHAWMALELMAGALSGVTGTVRYPAAFDLVEP